MPGWTAAYDWDGTMPAEALPRDRGAEGRDRRHGERRLERLGAPAPLPGLLRRVRSREPRARAGNGAAAATRGRHAGHAERRLLAVRRAHRRPSSAARRSPIRGRRRRRSILAAWDARADTRGPSRLFFAFMKEARKEAAAQRPRDHVVDARADDRRSRRPVVLGRSRNDTSRNARGAHRARARARRSRRWSAKTERTRRDGRSESPTASSTSTPSRPRFPRRSRRISHSARSSFPASGTRSTSPGFRCAESATTSARSRRRASSSICPDPTRRASCCRSANRDSCSTATRTTSCAPGRRDAISRFPSRRKAVEAATISTHPVRPRRLNGTAPKPTTRNGRRRFTHRPQSRHRCERDSDSGSATNAPFPWTSSGYQRNFRGPFSARGRGQTMRIQTVLDVFHERVPKTFGFLVDRHGFALDRKRRLRVHREIAALRRRRRARLGIDRRVDPPDCEPDAPCASRSSSGRRIRRSSSSRATRGAPRTPPTRSTGRPSLLASHLPRDLGRRFLGMGGARGAPATGPRAVARRIRAPRQGGARQARPPPRRGGVVAPELLGSGAALRVDPGRPDAGGDRAPGVLQAPHASRLRARSSRASRALA